MSRLTRHTYKQANHDNVMYRAREAGYEVKAQLYK